MKKLHWIVSSTLLLVAIVWVGVLSQTASWEESKKFSCYFDHGYGKYICDENENWDFSCQGEGARSCTKEWWESYMNCDYNDYNGGGELEAQSGISLYCTPKYSCSLEQYESSWGWELTASEYLEDSYYHCKIQANWSDYCEKGDEEGGESGTYCRVNGIGSLNFCWTSDWFDYNCDKWYSIMKSTSWYNFSASRTWGYYCQDRGLERGVSNLWVSSYEPSGIFCTDAQRNEQYRYCKDSWDHIFCPKLYSYEKNIGDGQYYFYEEEYGNYYCEMNSVWEDEWGLAIKDTNTDLDENYICSHLRNVEEQYSGCYQSNITMPSDLAVLEDNSEYNWYACPIRYSCSDWIEDDKSLCEENPTGGYYCMSNPNYQMVAVNDINWENLDSEWPYICKYSNGDIFSRNCSQAYDGRSSSLLSCEMDIEKHTITIDSNNNGYWSLNAEGSQLPTPISHSFASWISISINDNKLIIWGSEIVATPAESTSEYTYSFSAWVNTCGDALTQDCTITANFSRTAKEYTITFKDWDITYVYTWAYWSNVSVTAPNWQKEWYSLSWEGTIPTIMPAENIVITAQWTINQYTIKFNPNWWEGVFEPITQDYNTDISEPEDPIRTWYTFLGWYDWANKVTFPYQVKKTTTLTAHWSNNSWSSWYSGGWGSRWSSKQGTSDNHNSADDEDKNVEIKSLPNDDTTKPEVESKDDSTDTESQDWWSKNGWTTVWEKAEQYTKETTEAYTWAFTEWLTKYNNISDARMWDFLNRSEMAKITTIFATKFRWETPDENKKEFCSKYSDLWKVEEDTKEYIIQSCELWYMWYQANWVDALERFRPYTPVSVAEVSIILSRLMWWNRYAVSENKWYQWHLWAVYEHRLIDNISKPFNDITRKDAFTMLYRLSSSDILRD